MYIPHTPAERDEMLRVVGKKSLEELFADIPEKFRFPVLDLPEPVSEMEVE